MILLPPLVALVSKGGLVIPAGIAATLGVSYTFSGEEGHPVMHFDTYGDILAKSAELDHAVIRRSTWCKHYECRRCNQFPLPSILI